MRCAELRQGALQTPHALASDGDLLGAPRQILHLRVERCATSIPGGALRAPLDDVHGDSDQERRDLALSAEARQRAQELEERVLHQVVELGARDPLGEIAPHAGELAPDDAFQVMPLDGFRHQPDG
jgi:hypothetical protein